MHLTTCVPYTAIPLLPLLLLMIVDFPPASGISPLFSELTDTSVTISFEPLVGVVTVYVVEYHLERLTSGSARREEVLPTNEGLISTTIRGLAPNSPYLFRYFSRNELGDSAPSPYLNVVTGTQLQIYICDTQTYAHTASWLALRAGQHCRAVPLPQQALLLCAHSPKYVALSTFPAGYGGIPPLDGMCSLRYLSQFTCQVTPTTLQIPLHLLVLLTLYRAPSLSHIPSLL